MLDELLINETWSLSSEVSVLGSIMLDGLKSMGHCLRLNPQHFYLMAHQDVFRACQDILAVSDDASPDRVCENLKIPYGSADWAYISEMVAGMYRNFDPSPRVDAILEKYRIRRGAEICTCYLAAFTAGHDSGETLAELQAEVLNVIDDDSKQDDPGVQAYSEAAWDSLMRKAYSQEYAGLSYGILELDRHTYGMQPGEVTVVGARSGVGKSALMKQATMAQCARGIPTTLFSLEMTREQVLNGLWAIVSGVEYRKIVRSNLLSPDERGRVHNAYLKVQDWPLRIYDRSDLSIDQIVAYARMNIRKYGTKLVCVDYAQNVEAEGRDERTKVASVSRKLTKMTKDEGNSLLLLSQLRKVPHDQYSKPPTVADLRETGQLENDAHVVLLLHRGWDEDTASVSNDGMILIPKFRNGQTGALPVSFNPNDLCFQGR